MLEGSEAVTASLHALDAQVERFGRAVAGAGVMVGEDLGSPSCECSSERLDLGHVVLGAAGDGLVDEGAGLVDVVGEVDVAD